MPEHKPKYLVFIVYPDNTELCIASLSEDLRKRTSQLDVEFCYYPVAHSIRADKSRESIFAKTIGHAIQAVIALNIPKGEDPYPTIENFTTIITTDRNSNKLLVNYHSLGDSHRLQNIQLGGYSNLHVYGSQQPDQIAQLMADRLNQAAFGLQPATQDTLSSPTSD